jgi:hypothetical protein
MAVERTGGSRSLAPAAHRQRSAHHRGSISGKAAISRRACVEAMTASRGATRGNRDLKAARGGDGAETSRPSAQLRDRNGVATSRLGPLPRQRPGKPEGRRALRRARAHRGKRRSHVPGTQLIGAMSEASNTPLERTVARVRSLTAAHWQRSADKRR